MSLKEQLSADLRDAMRAGDETRKSTLRMLITAIRNAEIPPEGSESGSTPDRGRIELDDDGVLDIVRKEVKQRRDSIEMYAKANRTELVAAEEAEITVLQTYLPQQMSRVEIEAVAKAIIERLGAGGPSDKGKVMPVILGELRGKAEGRDINAVVTELLG
jgi:uncharacterized protein YqeY